MRWLFERPSCYQGGTSNAKASADVWLWASEWIFRSAVARGRLSLFCLIGSISKSSWKFLMSDFIIHQSGWSQTHVRKDFRRSISDMPQVIQPASFGDPHLVKRSFGDPVFSEFLAMRWSLLLKLRHEACTKIIWFWVFFVFWHMRSDQRAYRNVDRV